MAVIHLDTSVLIDIFAEDSQQTGTAMEQALDNGELLEISAVALYEWLRGPRKAEELRWQEALLPSAKAAPFEAMEAHRAALIYRALSGTRKRSMDFAIAACAIEHGAALWTLNRQDFEDIPGLMLYVVE